MIIYNDRKNKSNSKYICDRCKKELAGAERISIYAENHNIKIKKKKWDFCTRCYRLLKRGVEKRNTLEGGTNENT